MSKKAATSSSSRSKSKPRARTDYADRARRYARDVVAEKILACEYVQLACKRHLDDLRASRAKSCRWKFDRRKANFFCEFFEGLPHVKDDFKGNAGRGQLFKLEPWQCFIFCNIFGWVDKLTGYRRFTEAYVEVPRKNGKTPMAAGTGHFMLEADGEYGAEVYAVAASKDQAWEVFGAALNMAKASPDLRESFGVWCNAASIVVAEKNAVFKPIKGDPADGPSPHCVLLDEVHELKSPKSRTWARNGMVARRQPLLFMITTAGSDLGSMCYGIHLEVIEMLRGLRSADRLFGMIYTVDKGVDWKSREALIMANPNYGVSVNPETLMYDQQQAAQSALTQNQFKTKNLNIWVNADVAWMNMEKWNACIDASLRIEDFRDEDCFEGVDLASRTDTVSTIKLFVKRIGGDDHYFAFSRHYLNSDAVRDEKNTHFQEWVRTGWLIETPGNVTSYLQVRDDLVQDSMLYNLRELIFDPFHSAGLIQFIQEDENWVQSTECVDVKQTVENISPPMKEVEALVLSGRFHFDGNPALTWMVSNTVCHRDRKENIYPVRNRVQNKIDGTIALILAVKRAMAQTQLYTSPEVLVA